MHEHFHSFAMHGGTSSPSTFWSTFAGAFFGAAFAFLFGILTQWVTKRQDRFNRHRDAIVRLETLLNEHLDQISTCRATIEDSRRVLTSRHFTSRRFASFGLEPSLTKDFGTLDFINMYFGYSRYVVRLNADLEAFNRTIDQLERVVIGGQTLVNENFDFLVGGLADLSGAVDRLDEQVIHDLAVARVSLAKIKVLNKFWYPLLHKDWTTPANESEIAAESETLRAEMAAAAARR